LSLTPRRRGCASLRHSWARRACPLFGIRLRQRGTGLRGARRGERGGHGGHGPGAPRGLV